MARKDKKNRTCKRCDKSLSTPQRLRAHYNRKKQYISKINTDQVSIKESSDSEYYTADEGPDKYFQ